MVRLRKLRLRRLRRRLTKLSLRRSPIFQEEQSVCAATAPVVEGHVVKGLAAGEVILPASLLVAFGCSGGVCRGRSRRTRFDWGSDLSRDWDL